jgi:hypothetical protein
VTAKVKFAAAVGAAVFSTGVALTVAQPAIAYADPTETDTATATDGAGTGARPARTAADHRPATALKPAAARGLGDAPDVGSATRPRRGSGPAVTATTDLPAVSVNDAPRADPARTAEVVATPAISKAPSPAAAPWNPVTASIPASPAPAAAFTATPAPTATSVPPAPSAPRSLSVTTVTPAVSAKASSSASLVDNLLAPIKMIFGEGTALLVRRTFFNTAPSLNPVQLTGQSEGPITGTLGAVDPDGDVLTYSVTANPLHGSAVVNGDGSYTYTPAAGFIGNDSFVVAVTDTGFHINLLDLFRPASTSGSVAVAQGALASNLSFQFIYGTGSQYWSSAARSALESAARQLSSYIVVTSPVTITYDVTGQSSVLFTTLASAGSDFVNDGNGFLPTVVQNKIQTGIDANGSAADGKIDWNFGRSWGLGAVVSSSEYDFQSTAMHELLHTFGLLSNIDKAGSNTAPVWTIYDSFVVNAAGVRPISPSDYSWNTTFDPNLTGGNGGLYFAGPQAVAANQGYVALYTPSPFTTGSSLSHRSASNTLTSAIKSTGPGPRKLSPVEIGILADLGYTVAGTPVLLFVGLLPVRPRRRKD